MGVDYYETQEGMDDAFEDLMDREQDKARLREEILMQESTVEDLEAQVVDARGDLKSLQEELDNLEKN